MSQVTTAPADEPELDDEGRERPAPFWQRLVAGSSTWIGLILLGLIIVFSLLDPSAFVDVANARNIATDAAVLLVLATGMTYVIITAGIDLSVGGVLVFAGVVSAKAMHAAGGNNWGVIFLGLAVALAGGMAWGLINGFLVAKAKIPAFVVTLGTLGASLGSALVITGGVDVRDVPFKLITTIGTGRAINNQIPWLVLIAFAVAIVFGIILAATRFGRYTYAVGSNEEAARPPPPPRFGPTTSAVGSRGGAARRAGVPVDRHLIKVYALAGTLAGLAG